MFHKLKVLPTNIMALVAIVILSGILPFALENSSTVYAQTVDVILTLTGPSDAPNKGTITYELTIENVSGTDYSDITFWNDIPANVTYESGGTFVDANTDYVEFTVYDLPKNSKKTFKWTARLKSGLTGGTDITNNSIGFDSFSNGSTSGSVSTTVYDIVVIGTGPVYVQAGQNMTYEFQVFNYSDQSYSNLTLFNDLPTNPANVVTYVSGGTLLGSTGSEYVEFNIASVAANSSQTVSWVAKADSGLTVGDTFSNNVYGFIGGQSHFKVFGNINTKVEAPGTVTAIYKKNGRDFDVAIDGFSFSNFIHDDPIPGRNFKDDLLPEDLFLMFGPSVCKSGNTAQSCVLNAAAQTWLNDQIPDMDLGVCDGLAAASLHIFDARPFKGFTTPGTIQSGASNTADLNFPQQSVENYISYYYNTQKTDEVYGSQIITHAVGISNTLAAGMNATPPVFYTMGIEVLQKDGTTKDGHSIAPYGIEKVSDSESRILVYDNNFPKLRQYIVVNTVENSWRYVTEATPGAGSSIYQGSSITNSIRLTPLNARDNAAGVYFDCFFCDSTSGSAAAANPSLAASSPSAQNSGEVVRFSYTGEGAYVVVDDQGRETGSDRNTGTFVDQIPGAEVITHRGGLGLNVPPRINIPFSGPDDTFYSVFVHAATNGNVTNGDLNIIGPGFSLGVNDISLAPFQEFEIKFSPDGDHISFIATEDIEAPELVIAHDPINPGDPSVIFDIEGVVLLAGEKVMLDLDPQLEQIHFSHTGPEAENFVIDMRLIWPDGHVEDYPETIHIPAGVNTAFVDFGAWDGLLDPPIYVGGVLQNPSVNHRLKLESSTSTYDPTPQANAPAGVYHIEAIFSNVTEISLEDMYFTVAAEGTLATLETGNVVLNADGGPAGVGAKISVPPSALGSDGILHSSESFTFTFDIGLADIGSYALLFDANGVPHDWIHPDPAPSYDAKDASFAFALTANNKQWLPIIMK